MKESFSTRNELSRSNPKYITEPREQTAWFFLWQIKIRSACQCLAVTQKQTKEIQSCSSNPSYTAELPDQRRLLTVHPAHLQLLFLLLEPQVLLILSFSLSWTQNISTAVNTCAEWDDIKDMSDCALAVLVLSVCSISQVVPGCSGASQQWSEDKGSSQQNFDYWVALWIEIKV